MPFQHGFFGLLGLFISCGWLLGCGYRPVYSAPSAARLSVAAGEVRVADPGVVQAALAGARSELQRAGALGDGSSYPELVIDVLRVDEVSSGVAALQGGPMARGMGVAVVLRGRVIAQAGAGADQDTGDVRRTAYLDGAADPRVDSSLNDAALRAAAERAGRDLARAVLGSPQPADEAL